MHVKIFTVFHRAIDERLIFDLFTPAEVQDLFTHYGVNAAHQPKQITTLDGQHHDNPRSSPANMLLEYDLSQYDPTLQERGFMETSCYVHLHANGLHQHLDYIGVCQYDMRWTQAALALLRSIVAGPSQSNSQCNIVYGMPCGWIMNAQGHLHRLTFANHFNWLFLLKSYNRFFHRNWEPKIAMLKPLTLWQTYLMPRQQFADLAAWLTVLCRELYPWANQPPHQTHWGVMGGWTERAESLFIAARLEEGRIRFEPLPLHHDESIVKKLAITKEQYGSRPLSR